MNLEHDAEQCISYDGILECWEEGCRFLGGRHRPQLASVHDPDDYLAAANSPADRDRRFQDILDAYRALAELKEAGLVQGIGIGAKDWRSIQEIDEHVKLDWVMMANSFTVMNHPPELIEFIASLKERGVGDHQFGRVPRGLLGRRPILRLPRRQSRITRPTSRCSRGGSRSSRSAKLTA